MEIDLPQHFICFYSPIRRRCFFQNRVGLIQSSQRLLKFDNMSFSHRIISRRSLPPALHYSCSHLTMKPHQRLLYTQGSIKLILQTHQPGGHCAAPTPHMIHHPRHKGNWMALKLRDEKKGVKPIERKLRLL